MSRGKNVLNQPLQSCSTAPMTGFFRDGCCGTGAGDVGLHVVCIVATKEFLEFSKSRGNDLSTPVPEYQFPGLSPGDRWCLCASRWKEAFDAGMAPRVVLAATHMSMLEFATLEELSLHAVDTKAV
ncbi:MAG: DUF2237 domain-containing protein [Pyrinomonadaceae bacterium]|nr:DUF2237 domain-containing protein [Phycisphaerales bacterium]